MPVAVAKISIGQVGIELRSQDLTVAADEWGWDEFEVATGVTASSIFPPNITTIDVLYFESSQVVTIFQNSSATADSIDANGVLLKFGTSVTALTITNASGNTAQIRLGWFGT